MFTLMAMATGALFAIQAGAPVPTDTAVLRVGQRTITVLRGALGALTPAERVAGASARIRRALESARGDSVTTAPTADGTLFFVGGQPVFALRPDDADTASGVTLDAATKTAVQQLRLAVSEHHEQRAPGRLLRAVAWSLLATLLLSFAIRLILRVRRALLKRLHARDVGVGGVTLMRSEQVAKVAGIVVTAVAWVASIVAGDLYVTYVLKRFPWTRPWGEAAGHWVSTTIGNLLLGALRALPGLLVVVLIFLGIRLLSRVTGAVFTSVALGRTVLPGLHPETAEPTRRIVVALLWLFGVVVAYPYLPGSGTDAFKGVSVFAGLLLTLGSSGIVGQAMSGLTLMYSRGLRPGDYVRVGEAEGVVTQVGMLSTKIRTPKFVEYTIPSSVVLGQTIQNYSRLNAGSGVILHTTVTIGYDAPWRQVHAMLLEAAGKTPGLHTEPAPFILQRALSDFYVEYELNVFTDTPEQKPQLMSALHKNIQDSFNEHGVQIMSPHFMADKSQPVVVPRAQWYAAPARKDDGA